MCIQDGGCTRLVLFLFSPLLGFKFYSNYRMSRHREWDLKCKVYVGNLGSNTARGDLESSFGKYGALKNVWVARNPPGFAFVEFEDPRDAEDAVRAMDGM